MQHQQLSFDAAFNSVFLGTPGTKPNPSKAAIAPGDVLSVINKNTLQHSFHTVLSAQPSSLKTITRGACPQGHAPTYFENLAPGKNPSTYQNNSWAIVKTDNKNPKAEYIKAGLAQQHSQQTAKQRLQQIGKQ